jgi:hypothetical protein
MAGVSIDRDSFTTPAHPSLPWLARTLGYAGLVGLGLGLWGTLTSEVWRADNSATAAMLEADRSPTEAKVDPPAGGAR